MPITQTCYRCATEIKPPVSRHAYYVLAPDVVVNEAVEVNEAVVHTTETLAAVETLQTDHYPDVPADRIEYALVHGLDVVGQFGTPPLDDANPEDVREANAREKAPPASAFDRVEVANVADAPEGTVKIENRVEHRDIEKTALVCPDCHDPDTDAVIWGPEDFVRA